MKENNNTTASCPLRFLVSGGGTGGHIFPALSIAGALRRRHPDCEILFVGDEGRMEMERVPAAGYEIIGLPVSGFDRHNPLRNIKVLWRLWRSMTKARAIVRRFRPDIAIGVGGYASGPTLKAAQRAGIPTLLQEQNSYAGVTNKLLAAKASAICVAYKDMERFFPAGRIVMTGNPVRKALTSCTLSREEARRALGLEPERPLVLVVGGSLGARTINSAIIASMESGKELPYQILWQTGKNDAERCRQAVDKYKPSDIRSCTFIDDMATAYRAADLVVARAGAGTISELQLLGKAVVLIPSPNVAEDHQRKNAEALAVRDAAVMIPDADAATDLMVAVGSLMKDGNRRLKLERNIASMAMTDSDERIADAVDNIVYRKS